MVSHWIKSSWSNFAPCILFVYYFEQRFQSKHIKECWLVFDYINCFGWPSSPHWILSDLDLSPLSICDLTTPTLQQVRFFNQCFWSWLFCLSLCLPVWKAAVEGLSYGPNLVFQLKTEDEVMLWSSCEQKSLIPCCPDNNCISKAGALLHFDRIAVLRGTFLLLPPCF